MADQLVSLRVEGFRSIKDLTIPTDGLQVLIGENGAGKSTIIEAFELAKKAAVQTNFVYDLAARHGPFPEMLRVGATTMRLSVLATIDGAKIEYRLALAKSQNSVHASIVDETLDFGGRRLLERSATRAKFAADDGRTKDSSIQAEATALNSLWGLSGPEEVIKLRRLLFTIRVHLPFHTKPKWAYEHEQSTPPGLRTVSALEPIEWLARGGHNLASAYQKLIGRPLDWPAVLLDLKIGLGQDVVGVSVDVKQVGGFGELVVQFEGLGRVPASQLSDGQLSFVALVALLHLKEEASVVLIDEPEGHLHPAMLGTVAGLFVRLSQQHPLVLTTHSDALLDELPPESVRVVRLDAARATEMVSLDEEKLKRWRDEYRSVGALRREGVLGQVVEVHQ